MTLDREHADIIRRAVKAAARYYGIRIQGPGRQFFWLGHRCYAKGSAVYPVDSAAYGCFELAQHPKAES